jgi:hypothetical protein
LQKWRGYKITLPGILNGLLPDFHLHYELLLTFIAEATRRPSMRKKILDVSGIACDKQYEGQQ